MKVVKISDKCVPPSIDFSSSSIESKNSSLSFGGGYSQSSGWNANVTFTKKW